MTETSLKIAELTALIDELTNSQKESTTSTEELTSAQEIFNNTVVSASTSGTARLLRNMRNYREGTKNDFILMEGYARRFGSVLSSTIQHSVNDSLRFFDTLERAFKQTLLAMAAELAANAAIFGILSVVFPTSGLVGRGLGSFLFGHEGGSVTPQGIKKFHGGGLSGNEQPAILQHGEFVLSKSAVDSIGLSTVSQMNRTGRSGGGSINVVINNYGGNVEGIEAFITSNAFRDSLRQEFTDGQYN